MSNDDWNIYEYHVHLHDDCYWSEYPSKDGGTPVIVHPEWYKGKDVEILYQKLVEDMHKWIRDKNIIKQGEINPLVVIIRKRFGVE